MSTDRYRRALARAAWTWREGKFSRYHSKPRVKDRTSGRNAKRSARARDRHESDDET